MAEQEQRIRDRTNLSLTEIHKFYHEQRLQIEAEMAKRRQMKAAAAELSEGTLASSSTSTSLTLSSSSVSSGGGGGAGTPMSSNKDSSSGGSSRERVITDMRLDWTQSVKQRIEQQIQNSALLDEPIA